MKTVFKRTSCHIDAPFIRDERGRRVPFGVAFSSADDDEIFNGIFCYVDGFKRRRKFRRIGVVYFNDVSAFRLYKMAGGWYCLEKRDRSAGFWFATRLEITAGDARKFEASRGAAAEGIFIMYLKQAGKIATV